MPFRLPLLIIFVFALAGSARLRAQEGFRLQYHFTGKDTTMGVESLGLETKFRNASLCREYLSGLPAALRKKGYLSASVDSIQVDSTSGQAWLFTGEAYHWQELRVGAADRRLLEAAGWDLNADGGRLADFGRVDRASERFLSYMENHGYPFASVRLDSMTIEGNGVKAKLAIDKGPLYKIDSIRLSGNARMKKHFLERYLDIPAGSPYRKERLDAVSRRIMELPYAKESKPWDLTMLGTGSTLNLYLEPRKASRPTGLATKPV